MRFQNMLALAPLVHAMDLLEFNGDVNSTLLAKRDDCLDIDSNKPPVSSYASFNPVPACSPKYSLDSDGTCASHIATKNGCNAYCEEKRFWFFGKPVAINPGNMCYQGRCTQSESRSFAVTKTWTIQAGVNGKELSSLVAAFTAGASFAKAETTTKGTSTDRERADTSTCGNWFVAPIFQASCGTVSSKRVEKHAIVNPTGGFSYVEYCKGDVETSKKVCDVAPMVDADGNAKHQTIFVVKDCNTREFLGPDVQPNAFNQVVDWQEYYENVVAWSSKV